MPAITAHQSNKTCKVLFIGDSGTGKTGALASLAAAGYKLRIVDVDNGLDIVKHYLTHPNSQYVKLNPKCAENVSFITLTDKMRNAGGKMVPATASVWTRLVNVLMNGNFGEGENFGSPLTWDTDTVLVIDSLTMCATAALNYHLMMNGALGTNRTQNEGRRDIGNAQNILKTMLEMLFDENLKCNVVLTAHMTFVTDQGASPTSEEGKGQSFMGYPSAIGRALSPHIPRYFNTMLEARVEGTGIGAKHKIFTRSNGFVATKSTAPLSVAPSYDLATGLADYFKAVRS